MPESRPDPLAIVLTEEMVVICWNCNLGAHEGCSGDNSIMGCLGQSAPYVCHCACRKKEGS